MQACISCFLGKGDMQMSGDCNNDRVVLGLEGQLDVVELPSNLISLSDLWTTFLESVLPR